MGGAGPVHQWPQQPADHCPRGDHGHRSSPVSILTQWAEWRHRLSGVLYVWCNSFGTNNHTMTPDDVCMSQISILGMDLRYRRATTQWVYFVCVAPLKYVAPLIEWCVQCVVSLREWCIICVAACSILSTLCADIDSINRIRGLTFGTTKDGEI